MPSEFEDSLINAQLDRIVLSEGFAKAPRLRQFLRFAVEKYLSGNEEHLKETAIGVDLFKRAPGYDPTQDSIVRTTAARVRKNLREYYAVEGRNDPLLIDLPDEGYSPLIERRILEAAPEAGPDFTPSATDTQPGPTDTSGLSLSALPGVPLAASDVWIVVREWLSRIAIVALLLLGVSPMPRVPPYSPPVVVSFLRLTNDGRTKTGPLLIQGDSVYFTETDFAETTPASVPAAGGVLTRFDLSPVRFPRLHDVRNDRPEFLMEGQDSTGDHYLWRWVPGRPPHPLVRSDGLAGWISESEFADTDGKQLRVFDSSRLEPSPTQIQMPVRVRETWRWSSSLNTLRFTALNPSNGASQIWEMRGLHGRPAPLAGYPPDCVNGNWSADSGRFVFSAKGQTGYDGHDIWITDEDGRLHGQKTQKPIRLTFGPLDYQWPALSHDGHRIFAIGNDERAELVRYDMRAKRFLPYLSGMSGFETDFSRDGQWVVYASYPERTLWKVKREGGRPIQLTLPPLSVAQPHWSPDGTRIAFMGWHPGEPWRIYVVSSAGGSPTPALDVDGEQGVPTWSTDGKRLVYGEVPRGKPFREMAVHILDVNRRRVSTLPGSEGIFTPRWSPDGRYILGMTPDYKKLLVFDCAAGTWKELATFQTLDNPTWSSDSIYIYFNAVSPGNSLAKIGFHATVSNHAIYRLNIHKKTIERVADLEGFSWPRLTWIGVEPDGSPLAMRSVKIQELYALTLGQ